MSAGQAPRAGEKYLALEREVALILVETEAVSEAYPKLLESIVTALGWQFGAVWEEEPAQAAFVRCVETWCVEQRLAAFAEFSRGLAVAPGYGWPGCARGSAFRSGRRAVWWGRSSSWPTTPTSPMRSYWPRRRASAARSASS